MGTPGDQSVMDLVLILIIIPCAARNSWQRGWVCPAQDTNSVLKVCAIHAFEAMLLKHQSSQLEDRFVVIMGAWNWKNHTWAHRFLPTGHGDNTSVPRQGGEGAS